MAGIRATQAVALGHISLMRLRSDERAEGVISMAIAVLIIAFLGVAMWIGFSSIWGQAETQIQDNVTQIGS